jgi:hypothetical protein
MTIPARVTVEELATALVLDIAEVQAALSARNEPSTPHDVVGAEVALEVARVLGVSLSIEPRDLALETLYQVEIGGEAPHGAEMKGRVGFLVKGVLEHREDLDHEIESPVPIPPRGPGRSSTACSPRWPGRSAAEVGTARRRG